MLVEPLAGLSGDSKGERYARASERERVGETEAEAMIKLAHTEREGTRGREIAAVFYCGFKMNKYAFGLRALEMNGIYINA